MRISDEWTSQRKGWQVMTLVIASVMIVHQFIAAMPVYEMVMSAQPTHDSQNAVSCDGTCFPTIARICDSSHICATVQAAFSPLSPVPPIIVTLLALMAMAIRLSISRLSHGPWLRPPDRRRALLQVFLL